jgi:hypothetical protein
MVPKRTSPPVGMRGIGEVELEMAVEAKKVKRCMPIKEE